MANNLQITQGLLRTVDISLTDESGHGLSSDLLLGATATFLLREETSDAVNILRFTTVDNPSRLAISPLESFLRLVLQSEDTAALALGRYYYKMEVTRSDAQTFDAISWSPFDVVLGGSADVTPPAFDATIKIDHDFGLPGDLAYFSPGGSPIAEAQIRVYYKNDYDLGKLESPIGVTMTTAAGTWMNAILVPPGFDFVVRFEKPGEFGPDVARITAV